MAQHSSNTSFVPYSNKQSTYVRPIIERIPRRSLINPIFDFNETNQSKFLCKQKMGMKTNFIQTSLEISKQIGCIKKSYSDLYNSSQILRKDAGSGQAFKRQLKTGQTGPGSISRSEKSKMCVSQIYETSSGNSTLNIIQRGKISSNQKRIQSSETQQAGLRSANFKKVTKPQSSSTKTVPSFILKRKQAKQNSTLQPSVNQISQTSAQTKVNNLSTKQFCKTQKQLEFKEGHVFKKCSIQQNMQNIEQNPFDDFQKLKLSYPKATASTISSSLQSYQSLKNFHDLQDLQQYQIAQKTIEQSEKLPRLMNRQKIIAKEQKCSQLQNQFNDLFGQDQQQEESQQLKNQIANELLSLF